MMNMKEIDLEVTVPKMLSIIRETAMQVDYYIEQYAKANELLQLLKLEKKQHESSYLKAVLTNANTTGIKAPSMKEIETTIYGEPTYIELNKKIIAAERSCEKIKGLITAVKYKKDLAFLLFNMNKQSQVFISDFDDKVSNNTDEQEF